MPRKIVKIRPLISEKVTHIKTYNSNVYTHTHTCLRWCTLIVMYTYTCMRMHVHEICEQLGLK